MKIGIDFRLANTSHRGMAKFCREIVRQLLLIDKTNEYVLYIDDKINVIYESTVAKYEYRMIHRSNYIISEQIYLPYAVSKDNCDVLWCPYNTFPILLHKRIKLIVTIHDLIFFYKAINKSSFYQKVGAIYRKFILKKFSKKIFAATTVSEYSSKEISKYLPQVKNVVLTYNCIDDFIRIRNLYRTNITLLPQKDFFFTVSGDAPSKNLKVLIDVFLKNFPDEILYIAGVNKNSTMRIEYNNIHFIDAGIPAETLLQYYVNCKCFIFPSLYEGFGIPIIEAMACEKPIISSNTCSLPEILCNKGIQVNPTEDGLRYGINEFLNNNTKYDFNYKSCLYRFKDWSNQAVKFLKLCSQI